MTKVGKTANKIKQLKKKTQKTKKKRWRTKMEARMLTVSQTGTVRIFMHDI